VRQSRLFWAASAAAVLCLALVAVDTALHETNRALQAELARRQDFINESVQLSRINEAVIKLLANAAVNGKDDGIRDLLGRNGITVTVNPPAPAQ
jgi:hypothetical protein